MLDIEKNNKYFILTVKNPISNTAGINGRTVITIINYNYLNMYTHTHIFTHIHTRKYTYTHTCTHICTCAYNNLHIQEQFVYFIFKDYK